MWIAQQLVAWNPPSLALQTQMLLYAFLSQETDPFRRLQVTGEAEPEAERLEDGDLGFCVRVLCF